MGTIHKTDRKAEYLAKRYGSKRSTDTDHAHAGWQRVDAIALLWVLGISSAISLCVAVFLITVTN